MPILWLSLLRQSITKRCSCSYNWTSGRTKSKVSRAKNQNVSQEFYEQCVIAVHGDDPYYNSKEGGYYHDIWNHLALNKAAYLSVQYLDSEVYTGVLNDLINAAKMIDFMIEHKMPFLRKYDSYSCKSCEYLNACKPWLTVDGGY